MTMRDRPGHDGAGKHAEPLFGSNPTPKFYVVNV